MPDMNGEPTHGPTDETDPETTSSEDTTKGSEATPLSPTAAADTTGHRLTAGLTIGSRVVVRYRLAEGAEAAATDFVGELVARNDDFLVVDTKTERVKLIRADVVAAKDVPPPASRPGRAHERVSADDLEKLMAKGWQALDRGGIGDWVLRASDGFTGRANSALVVGDPSLPVDKAIDFVEKWYAERDRPPIFQVHGERGFAVDGIPAAAALLERGYAIGGGRDDWQRVLVMTGLSAAVPPLTEASVPVTADAELKLDWLMSYAEQRTVVPGATEAVLTGSDGQLFLSVTDPESKRIIALARMAIHPGWAGIFGLWVHPDHRRKGLATTIVSAIAMVARENNMPAIYLQVSADNADGVAFWEGLGFGVHHEYTYLARPTA
ncbi:GCN5 family acetyltransferase [Terrabacter sp. Root85]|nr:GCN5 family acetyltransferase [Terrabacter sp. Root85]KRF48564.1 GCN5 family acetyltransferase [Terrabacter sp. Soil811]